MEAPHLERKLVAILAADIEGFSSHMERDEAGTQVDGPSMAPTTIEEVVGVELAFWDSIKDSGSVAELDA